MRPPSFVGLYQISHHIAINFCLMIPPPQKKELVVEFLKDFQAAFPTSRN